MDISALSNVIFDCDGVLLDTNPVKERNILAAVSGIADETITREFISYFTHHNGIPRETKIANFYSPEETQRILGTYNRLNSNSLADAPLTEGIRKFLSLIHSLGIGAYVLSGGDESELIDVLRKKQILSNFRAVRGGPKTKAENYGELNLKGTSLMIGDSLADYEFARQFELEFIFMRGYTQFKGWQEFFRDVGDVTVVKDFKDLMNSNRWAAEKPC